MPYNLHDNYIKSITTLDDRLKQSSMNYRNNNIETIKQYQKKYRDHKIKCECGSYTTDMQKHIKGATHFNNLMRQKT